MYIFICIRDHAYWPHRLFISVRCDASTPELCGSLSIFISISIYVYVYLHILTTMGISHIGFSYLSPAMRPRQSCISISINRYIYIFSYV